MPFSRAVVLGELDLVKDAFSLTQLTGRMQGPKIKIRSSNGQGGPMRGYNQIIAHTNSRLSLNY